MPWIAPSHQAPALALKLWRPRWFSGLALVLGSAVPDLEFIARVDKACVVSHTVMGQLTFTLPVALALYVLATELLIPWVVPHLPSDTPARWHDLLALETPRGRQWLPVACSAVIGGLSHLALDGFTHGDASGWAVALLPSLRAPIRVFGWAAPAYERLQVGLTVVLGAITLASWRRIASGRLLWAWRGETPRCATRSGGRARRVLASWTLAWAVAGVGWVTVIRPPATLAVTVELAAYAALDWAAVAVILAALVDRGLRRRASPVVLEEVA